MKKLLLLLGFLSFSNTIAQTLLYPDIKLKQHLKEIIAIQSLIAENRVDELYDFMNNNNYVPMENQAYVKYFDDDEQNEVSFMFSIDQTKESDYIPIYLTVRFLIKDNGSLRKFKIEEAEVLKNKMIKLLEPSSMNFYAFNNMVSQVSKFDPSPIKMIDRYNAVLDQKTGSINLRVSNTMKITDYECYFWGPGKTTYTHLSWQFYRENESSKEYSFSILIKSKNELYRNATNFESTNPIDKKPFNTQFFMSLENFNDRIWMDN